MMLPYEDDEYADDGSVSFVEGDIDARDIVSRKGSMQNSRVGSRTVSRRPRYQHTHTPSPPTPTPPPHTHAYTHAHTHS